MAASSFATSSIWQLDDSDVQVAIGLNEILNDLKFPNDEVVPLGCERRFLVVVCAWLSAFLVVVVCACANNQGNSILLHVQAAFGNANEMAE